MGQDGSEMSSREGLIQFRIPVGLKQMFELVIDRSSIPDAHSLCNEATTVFLTAVDALQKGAQIGSLNTVTAEFDPLDVFALELVCDQSEDDDYILLDIGVEEDAAWQSIQSAIRYLCLDNLEQFFKKVLAFLNWTLCNKYEAWEPVAFAEAIKKAWLLPLGNMESYFNSVNQVSQG